MKVGGAEWLITPPFPIVMGGYAARSAPASGVHDDLFVRCAYFESENCDSAAPNNFDANSGGSVAGGSAAIGVSRGGQHLLLNYDILSLPESFVTEVKRRLSTDVGVPASNVVMHATHTHSGPDISHMFTPQTDDLMRLYTDYLVEVSVAVSRRAMNQPVAAELAAKQTQVAGVGCIRRLGQAASLPLSTMGWFAADNPRQLKVAVVSFPCHPTVMSADNLLISADYPGVVIRTIRQIYGRDAIVLFLTGAAGDVSTRFTRREQSFAEVERIGTLVASAAIRSLQDALSGHVRQICQVHSVHSICSSSTTVHLQAAPLPDVAQIAALQRTATAALQVGERAGVDWRENLRAGERTGERRIVETQLQGIQAVLSRAHVRQENLGATVSVWRFDDAVTLAFWPCEPFHSYHDQFVEIAGQPSQAVLVGYSNGMLGYVPDVTTDEDVSYEVLMSVIGKHGGEQLMERTRELFERMQG